MKKIISLSMAVMLGIAAIAQDTIPGRRDSFPANNNWKRDTLNQKWKDSLRYDTSMAARNKWPNDSLQKRQWSKNDTSAMRTNNGKSDSMLFQKDREFIRDSANRNFTRDSMGKSNMTRSIRDSSRRNTLNRTNNLDSSTTGMARQDDRNSMSDSVKVKEPATDRVLMKDDKMYIVKNGDSTIMEKSYKLESGAIVTTDGKVKYPSGKLVELKNGQFISIVPKEPAADTNENKSAKKSPAAKPAVKSKKKVKS